MALPVQPLSIRAFVVNLDRLEMGSSVTGIEKVPGGSADLLDGFTDFVESFDSSGSANSEFSEEFIGELSESIFVHPKH